MSITDDLADVILVPLSGLEPWQRNYRRGDVEIIKASIARFGFNSAIRVREGVVYAGNHAYKALVELHTEKLSVPRHIIEAPSGDWLVPVIKIDHLSLPEAEAFAIADNRTQEVGHNDSFALADLLRDIPIELLSAAAFTPEDIEALLKEVEPPSFDNPGGSKQGGLDDKPMIECPQCGHNFERPPR